MEGAFLDGGPGWEVAVSFTDEMDEFGLSGELPLDLLLVLPGELPEMLTAAVSWEVTVGLTAHGGAATSQKTSPPPSLQADG